MLPDGQRKTYLISGSEGLIFFEEKSRIQPFDPHAMGARSRFNYARDRVVSTLLEACNGHGDFFFVFLSPFFCGITRTAMHLGEETLTEDVNLRNWELERKVNQRGTKKLINAIKKNHCKVEKNKTFQN